MRPRRLGILAAALSTTSLAFTATAPAATTGPPAQPVHAVPADCSRGFSVAEHRWYATRVFRRATVSRKATHHLARLRSCQRTGPRGLRATHRTERKLKRWRSLYHCTQSQVVNCIRDATRLYGGSFAHNVACARSESGLNPYARNGGGSGATGLFQFMPGTWATTLARMRVGHGKSIYSAKWQARVAVWKFRHDGFGEWSGAGC